MCFQNHWSFIIFVITNWNFYIFYTYRKTNQTIFESFHLIDELTPIQNDGLMAKMTCFYIVFTIYDLFMPFETPFVTSNRYFATNQHFLKSAISPWDSQAIQDSENCAWNCILHTFFKIYDFFLVYEYEM